ncbi:uncharacterized protein MKK02DRAFT_31964 [Dioszegia hungarica]|uniref:Uncharacterized protein n=1 Tax=Dioszegia hungarica TaxID=4972 RepID=A0AA38HFD6_9TREE|nr:uncharacterized protein MKK02DRAFT_31964 [Dioszegia hungarica]KAI9638539.1 hypothetical protein MKK02DRAFT_31964 [Dioszegia hungarica]
MSRPGGNTAPSLMYHTIKHVLGAGSYSSSRRAKEGKGFSAQLARHNLARPTYPSQMSEHHTKTRKACLMTFAVVLPNSNSTGKYQPAICLGISMVFSIGPRESSGSRYYQVLGLVYQKYRSFSATRPFLSCFLSGGPARRTLPLRYMRICTDAASASVTTNGTPLSQPHTTLVADWVATEAKIAPHSSLDLTPALLTHPARPLPGQPQRPGSRDTRRLRCLTSAVSPAARSRALCRTSGATTVSLPLPVRAVKTMQANRGPFRQPMSPSPETALERFSEVSAPTSQFATDYWRPRSMT